ncbi:MAG: SDR family NAD(P)-dependent oxidoreductase [Thermodesulfobacteriota bacterium]
MPGIRDLKNKIVVITGAGSGIGRAAAHAFAKEGAAVVITDIHAQRLAEAESELARTGADVSSKVVDVADKAQLGDLCRFVIDTRGRVDVLHANAGIGYGGPLEIFPMEDFEKVMAVNFWHVVYSVGFFLPHMIKQRSGHIVVTASAASYFGLPGLGAYTASKFAVAGYLELLRAELHRHNIGVTTICPGFINTNIVKDGKSTLLPGAKADQEKMAAFYQRFGWPPERVAKAVVKGVRKNRALVPVGPEAWAQWYLKRLSPGLYNLILRIGAKLSL